MRLFPPVAERLEELAEERGVTRSQVVRELILEATIPEGAPPVPSEEELLRLLGVAARLGSVPAIRLLLEEYRRREDDRGGGGLGMVDELAERRQARG